MPLRDAFQAWIGRVNPSMKSFTYIAIIVVSAIVVFVAVGTGAFLIMNASSGSDAQDSPSRSERRQERLEAPSSGEESVSLRLASGESGVLEHDSGARMEIPKGALTETVTVSISEVEPPSTDLPEGVELGMVFDFSIGQANLAGPVTIHIPYDPGAGTTAEDVRALHWDDERQGWEMIEGEVDESDHVVRVEVSELSWFSTLVRHLTGLYDYTSEDAGIESCRVSPENIASSREFRVAAKVNNRSVEERMYLEVLVRDGKRGLEWKYQSASYDVDAGDTQEFAISAKLSPPGEHSIECVLQVGLPDDELIDVALPTSLSDFKLLLAGWLGPELDRVVGVKLLVEEFAESSKTQAKLSECSAEVGEDGAAVLKAVPFRKEKSPKFMHFKVAFTVYHNGAQVYGHEPDETGEWGNHFKNLNGAWTTTFNPEAPGNYTLDCVLIGLILRLGEKPAAFKILERIQDPLGMGSILEKWIKAANDELQWYSTTNFDWPAAAADEKADDTEPDVQGKPSTFVSVSSGQRLTCGLREDNSVACWGTTISTGYGVDLPLAGHLYEYPSSGSTGFTSISAGYAHACALKTDGSVFCWGLDPPSPPSGEFTSVTSGWTHSCGVRPGGSVDCWGSNDSGQASPPAGEFVSVDAGLRHTCGLKVDGSAECWGSNQEGQAEPPTGVFVSISAGYVHTCGLRAGGVVECWGDSTYGETQSVPGNFTAISAGSWFLTPLTCGVRTDGVATCWGNDLKESFPLDGEVSSISVGYGHVCGAMKDGSVECVGDDSYGQSNPPDGFVSVSAGSDPTCGLKIDGTVTCWGDNDHAVVVPADGEFSSFSMYSRHACGLRMDGSVTCWGDNESGQSSPPPGEFTGVTTGRAHSCGLRMDGSVTCWGSNESGQSSPASGAFASVSGGQGHTCGVRNDGSMECWGDDEHGQSTPPAGKFISSSGGDTHSCGIRTDGAIACWGDNEYGQSSPPSGEFTSVSARTHHSCGIRTDGSIACWGRDDIVRTPPPASKYTWVSAGYQYSCGVRTDSWVECW